ncbi:MULTISPECIES: hypothetical protein [unclassified Microcoleus]|uniref:hypothetical protein n=1 Tax=unclassified Microcoleus TaxID=2642155 RepID=UPI002FCE818C
MLQHNLWLVTLVSELDNFGTAGAKSADRAIGHFCLGLADIYNSNENFSPIAPALSV